MLNDRFRTYRFLLVLIDCLLVVASYLFAFWLRATVRLPGLPTTLPMSRFGEVDHLIGLMVLAHAVIAYGFGLYDERLLLMGRGRLARISFAAAGLHVLLLIGYRFFTTPLYLAQSDSALYFPRSVYLVFFPLSALLAILWRASFLRWLKGRLGALRVALVGTGPTAMELIAEIQKRPEAGLQVVGVFEEAGVLEQPEAGYCGVPWLGSHEDIVETTRKQGISEIIISSTNGNQAKLLETIARSELTEARVSIVPGFYELLIGKVHRLQVHDIPLVEVLREPVSRPSRLVKRILDLTLAILLSVLALPIAVVTAVLIRAGDSGPILFRQERAGKDRRTFWLYKFRTMMPDAEKATGPVLAGREDDRVTRLGKVLRKYRIDELPQLWNVLRGQMSLVGPRPERPYFVEQFVAKVPGYAERFKVKPGLTGLAQVRGTYETTAQNKLRYDLAYIYNQSIWLDLSILAETAKEILNSRGW